MAKISQMQRTKGYCRITGQLSDHPFIQVNNLARKVKLHRNTVSRYIKKIYNAFKSNIWQSIMPVLRKIGIGYETFSEWKKTLKNHCTIHIEFYPQGVTTYVNYCLLISTEYPHSVKSVFSMLPTTPVVIEMGGYVLVFVKVSPAVTEDVISVIQDVKKKEMIDQITHAIVQHDYR